MKKNLCIALTVLIITPALYASLAERRFDSFVQGTVVSIQKHKVSSPSYTMGGSNPSDAPLTSSYYTFEVAVKVDCNTYVGRYQTPFNYLPSVFTVDRPIQVRLTKHVIYFDPNDPDMRLGIVRRISACSANR